MKEVVLSRSIYILFKPSLPPPREEKYYVAAIGELERQRETDRQTHTQREREREIEERETETKDSQEALSV